MASNEQLILKIQTFDNALTERKDDSTGKVMLNGSVGMEQLARDILPVVGDVQYETIMGIANRLVEAAIKRLQMGCAVNFGICHARPSVSGPFYGKDPRFNPEINSIGVSISATQGVREAMKSIPVEMAGVAPTGPVINYVTDVKTGEMNGALTPVRNLKIYGVRLMIAGESEQNGVYFVSANEGERVKVDVTDMVDNTPSQLTVLTPDLSAGEWYVEVVTQYSNGKTTVKEPRTYRFEQVLTVVSKG